MGLVTLILMAACNIDLPVSDKGPAKVDGNEYLLVGRSERIQFAKGKTDGSWTRGIPANGATDFVIGAKKGQAVDYSVGYDANDSDVEVLLIEPESKNISQETGPKVGNEFAVKKTGDHHLRVTNRTDKEISITLYLAIR